MPTGTGPPDLPARPGPELVSRRKVPLTGAEVDLLPAACRSCLFWEDGSSGPLLPPALRAQHAAPVDRKRAWISARVEEGTPPGAVLVVDDEVAGYALFAPAGGFAPRSSLLPRVSPDALLLATLWVAAAHRGVGLGRLLVQAALREALRLDLTAVEAYGDRRFHERACVLPVTWLLHEGFEVHREHPRTPLLRLETRRLARWAGSLEHAWEEVLGRIPRRAPVPAGEPVPTGAPVRGSVVRPEVVRPDAVNIIELSRHRDTSG
jgi:GNAT superfamily N-acetyltransferase